MQTVLMLLALSPLAGGQELKKLSYNNKQLAVDLGVGLWAWPLPMDYDEDGDMDMVVVCPGKASNGTYFFENAQGKVKFPVFKPGIRISKGLHNVSSSYTDGAVHVLSRAHKHPDFRLSGLAKAEKLETPARLHPGKLRANQWKVADYDGDGVHDLLVGIGYWSDYGWDDAYNNKGEWTNGPLHGYVYWIPNKGTDAEPKYAPIEQVIADGKPIDVFGMPSPNLADFDGDGDLDLLCGEFRDSMTYFQNVGSRTKPAFAAGRQVSSKDGPIIMDLCMIVPVALDWDADGDVDLVVGQEDGRVALVEHTGVVEDGLPLFAPPRFFQQEAEHVKVGALATPTGVDWDSDGDEDLICGDTAGYVNFVENTSGGASPSWAPPVPLKADGQTIRIQAGSNGSIQGPCEAKWGYTVCDVADWNHDGLLDIVVNSIWGEILWYQNIGTPTEPRLAAAQKVEVRWDKNAPKPAWNWWNPRGNQLVTQWRTSPVVVDLNRDGLRDLVILDHEGYLAFFERAREDGKLVLRHGQRIFQDENGKPLRLNPGRAGRSGRRKLVMTDWDRDGDLDLIVNGSANADFLENIGEGDVFRFVNRGAVSPTVLGGHTTCPTTVDFDQDGVRDLLIGGEDGFFYFLQNPNNGYPEIVVNEFIYTKAPFPQCHASTIEQTSDGLVAAWFGGTHEKHPDVGIWVSRKAIGGKWSAPVEVANGVVSPQTRYPTWNPVLFQQPGGPLHLFYKEGPTPRDWWGMLISSDDGGRTWSEPRRLPDGVLGPVKNKPVLLRDGTLLCGSSTEHDGWRVHMEKTSDLGKTWRVTPPLNDGKTFGAIQPTILVHAPEKIQILCRSRQGRVTECWSTDGGDTWSEMKATSLPNPNSGIDAVQLADGRSLVVYNNTPRGRSPLNVAVSDDGVNWTPTTVLESEPGEYSYPAVIQTSDGLVHITYTWKRRRIKHVVLDPQRLLSE